MPASQLYVSNSSAAFTLRNCRITTCSVELGISKSQAMPKLTRIQLVRVYYIPKVLEPGLLYVSEEFGAAVHLCACGCGAKVSTPLGPAEWVIQETAHGPSLRPSVGNWQLPCQSPYWICRGEIVWSDQWTNEQIRAGRRA